MSEENLNWFNKKYTNNYETEVLFNWASNISLENIINNYRKELFLEDKIFTVGYAKFIKTCKKYDGLSSFFICRSR